MSVSMSKRAIHTPAAPEAVGPYSQAIVANGLIFVSGQLPIDREGKLLTEIRTATAQCLDNIRAILEAAGAGLEDLVKVTIYVTDLADFAAINEVYAGYFTKEPPARAFVQVVALPKGAPIEIEGIALKRT